MEKLEHYRKINPEHNEFYDAEVLTIKGIQVWMERTVREIEKAIEIETHPVLRENLEKMRECNEYLINGAPRTLREACQWICWFNMASREYNRDGAGCQLDEILRPYYERDLEAGIITPDEAKYYIACLLLNDPHYYQLGGLSPDGKDMVSYFSYMILEAADWLVHPVTLPYAFTMVWIWISEKSCILPIQEQERLALLRRQGLERRLYEKGISGIPGASACGCGLPLDESAGLGTLNDCVRSTAPRFQAIPG